MYPGGVFRATDSEGERRSVGLRKREAHRRLCGMRAEVASPPGARGLEVLTNLAVEYATPASLCRLYEIHTSGRVRPRCAAARTLHPSATPMRGARLAAVRRGWSQGLGPIRYATPGSTPEGGPLRDARLEATFLPVHAMPPSASADSARFMREERWQRTLWT